MNELIGKLTDVIEKSKPEEISNVDQGKLQCLLHLIGSKFIQSDVYTDGLQVATIHKDPGQLANLDSKNYISDRNQLLISFINGTVNFNIEDQHNTVILFAFAVALEMIYYLRNLNLILPHCFLTNILQCFTSGSKTVSVLNGKVSPSCGYTSYKNWLCERGAEKNECPNKDVVTFFDNIGRYIVKSYRVLSARVPTADIITATLHFIMSNKRLQFNASYKPGTWRRKSIDASVQEKMRNIVTESNNLFRHYRIKYVEIILEKVMRESNDVEQKLLQFQQLPRICTSDSCKRVYESLKRKCDICGSKVEKRNTKNPRIKDSGYFAKDSVDIGQKLNKNKCEMKVGEPVLANPNSYISIKKVLEELKENHSIGDKRQWVFLGCDGPPYCLANRIIDESSEVYDWVSLIPGLGHLHMNEIKTLFKVLDKILLEPLGKEVLNFDSPKAYKFFTDAKDTHKSFQTLQILLHGTASEMVRNYLLSCKENETPRAAGFIQWMECNQNESFTLVSQLIFNYTLAIYIQKVGVRCNDESVISAGRYKFMPMFYAFKHPIYQEIEYRDLRNRALYPKEIKDLTDSNMSFSSSLDLNHEGGDFCLENKIKEHKLIAPKGRVADDMWLRISRGLDAIEKISSHTSQLLKLEKQSTYRNVDIYDEIVTWRAILRSSNFLTKTNEEGTIKNIYGEGLSIDLDDFAETINEKMHDYWGHAARNVPLQNICRLLNFVQIHPCEDLGDLLYSESDEADED